MNRLVTRQPTMFGGNIWAEWWGGAYVEITFDGSHRPSEVLNVWNDETDKAVIPFTQEALDGYVREWIAEMDADSDWPSWYADYVRNGA